METLELKIIACLMYPPLVKSPWGVLGCWKMQLLLDILASTFAWNLTDVYPSSQISMGECLVAEDSVMVALDILASTLHVAWSLTDV